jgi:hypothetical protein
LNTDAASCSSDFSNYTAIPTWALSRAGCFVTTSHPVGQLRGKQLAFLIPLPLVTDIEQHLMMLAAYAIYWQYSRQRPT